MPEDPLTGDQPVRGGVEAEEKEAEAYGVAFAEAPAVTVGCIQAKNADVEINRVICV